MSFPLIPLDFFSNFPTCESTNDEIFSLLKEADHAFVWTENQTKGRGSRGRSWTSPAYAGLAFSMGWKNGPSPVDFPYPIFGGVFVYNVLVELIPSIKQDLKLKWPNDLILKGKKLCGVLCESKWKGTDEVQTVVGVGINLKNHIELQMIDKPFITLESQGINLSAKIIISTAHDELKKSEYTSSEYINQLWLKSSIWEKGSMLSVSNQGTQTEGLFLGLSTQGALMLGGTNGDITEIHHAASDFKVTVIPRPSPASSYSDSPKASTQSRTLDVLSTMKRGEKSELES